MNTSAPIQWRKVPWALWCALWRVNAPAYLAALVLIGGSLALAMHQRHRPDAVASDWQAQATSITPITNVSASSSGLAFSGDRYDVTCSVSGTATLYPAGHNGTAWTVYYGYPCSLDSSVSTRITCPFPANRLSGWTWNAYKTGSATLTSCTAEQAFAPIARQRSGGGGGPVGNGRVAPDSSDVLVYYDYAGPGSTTWDSVGTNTLQLSTTGGAVAYPETAVFGDGWWAPTALHSGAGGAYLRPASTTTVGESQTLTASAWAYIPSLPGTANNSGLLVKEARDNGWMSPYGSWSIYLSQDGSLIAVVMTASGYTILQSDPGSVGIGLHHFGITYSSQTLTLWLDGGVAAGTSPQSIGEDINFDGHGPYLFGGFPAGGSAWYSGGWLADIRIASVARDASWWASVWASRRTV